MIDALNLVIWTQNFLEDHSFNISDNIVYQHNNKGAILLDILNGHQMGGIQNTSTSDNFVYDQINQTRWGWNIAPQMAC